MFIEQAYRAKHEFWRYLIGSLIIIGFSLIGQLPLTAVLLLKGDILGGGGSMHSLLESSNLSTNMFTFLILLSFVFAIVGIYLVVRFFHKQSFKSIITTRRKIDWKRLFLSFGIVALYIIASTAYDYYAHPDHYMVNFELVPFAILFAMAIIMVPIQTTVEELVFRGYLMQGFGMLAKNRWFPLLMTSLIFGSLHFFNPEVDQFGNMIMFYYIGTGLFLGILSLMDEGLELSMGFHAANNLITVLLVTANWTAFQAESVLKDVTDPKQAGWEVFVPMLVIYPILLLIFSRVYHWKNWKNKLLGQIDPPREEIEEVA